MQIFSHWPWKRYCLFPRLQCPYTKSLTTSTERLFPHCSLRGLIPNLYWGGLRCRREGCFQYGRASALFLTEWSPCLFWVQYSFKVCYLNLETDRVVFVLQVVAVLLIKFQHTIERNGDLLYETIIYLVEKNCCRHGGSIYIISSKILQQ